MKKCIFTLALALVMTLVLAGSTLAIGESILATASEGDVGYNPNPFSELLWWEDVDLTQKFTEELEIRGVSTTVELGYNTIEIFDSIGTFYLLTLHPQFLPDYDDQTTAEYVLGIDGIKVWNGLTYVDVIIRGDTAILPNAYTLYNDDIEEYYLDCQVSLTLISTVTGSEETLTWDQAYLQIPAGVPPVPPTPTPIGN
ncbi:MAG: hypothetical protein LBL25_04355 [Oscillospiraceae bacterium]|nr:hypothetical protein [Oscillospiraceae bacterium]